MLAVAHSICGALFHGLGGFLAHEISVSQGVGAFSEQAGRPTYRATCIKIIHVIRLLVQQKLHRIIKAHAAHRMAPHSGTQCDIWSEKSARNSFFCMRQSMILEPELVYEAGSIELGKHNGHLLDVAPMLDFTVFTNTAHSAKNVASMKKKVLAKKSQCVILMYALKT